MQRCQSYGLFDWSNILCFKFLPLAIVDLSRVRLGLLEAQNIMPSASRDAPNDADLPRFLSYLPSQVIISDQVVGALSPLQCTQSRIAFAHPLTDLCDHAD